MTGKTKKLGLTTYETAEDAASTLVYTFIDQTSASLITSNYGIIDEFAIHTTASVISLDSSLTIINTCMVKLEDFITVTETAASAVRTRPTSAVIQIVPPETGVALDDDFTLIAPSEIDGFNFVRIKAYVNNGIYSSGSEISGSIAVQVQNLTKYSSEGNTVLSGSGVTIYEGDEFSIVGETGGLIQEDYDDVSTDDIIRIWCSASGLGEFSSGCGLQVILEFLEP